MPSKKKKKIDQTPFAHKVIMAVTGVSILLLLYLFFGNQKIPTEITYRNVGGSGDVYVIRKENNRPY